MNNKSGAPGKGPGKPTGKQPQKSGKDEKQSADGEKKGHKRAASGEAGAQAATKKPKLGMKEMKEKLKQRDSQEQQHKDRAKIAREIAKGIADSWEEKWIESKNHHTRFGMEGMFFIALWAMHRWTFDMESSTYAKPKRINGQLSGADVFFVYLYNSLGYEYARKILRCLRGYSRAHRDADVTRSKTKGGEVEQSSEDTAAESAHFYELVLTVLQAVRALDGDQRALICTTWGERWFLDGPKAKYSKADQKENRQLQVRNIRVQLNSWVWDINTPHRNLFEIGNIMRQPLVLGEKEEIKTKIETFFDVEMRSVLWTDLMDNVKLPLMWCWAAQGKNPEIRALYLMLNALVKNNRSDSDKKFDISWIRFGLGGARSLFDGLLIYNWDFHKGQPDIEKKFIAPQLQLRQDLLEEHVRFVPCVYINADKPRDDVELTDELVSVTQDAGAKSRQLFDYARRVFSRATRVLEASFKEIWTVIPWQKVGAGNMTAIKDLLSLHMPLARTGVSVRELLPNMYTFTAHRMQKVSAKTIKDRWLLESVELFYKEIRDLSPWLLSAPQIDTKGRARNDESNEAEVIVWNTSYATQSVYNLDYAWRDWCTPLEMLYDNQGYEFQGKEFACAQERVVHIPLHLLQNEDGLSEEDAKRFKAAPRDRSSSSMDLRPDSKTSSNSKEEKSSSSMDVKPDGKDSGGGKRTLRTFAQIENAKIIQRLSKLEAPEQLYPFCRGGLPIIWSTEVVASQKKKKNKKKQQQGQERRYLMSFYLPPVATGANVHMPDTANTVMANSRKTPTNPGAHITPTRLDVLLKMQFLALNPGKKEGSPHRYDADPQQALGQMWALYKQRADNDAMFDFRVAEYFDAQKWMFDSIFPQPSIQLNANSSLVPWSEALIQRSPSVPAVEQQARLMVERLSGRTPTGPQLLDPVLETYFLGLAYIVRTLADVNVATEREEQLNRRMLATVPEVPKFIAADGSFTGSLESVLKESKAMDEREKEALKRQRIDDNAKYLVKGKLATLKAQLESIHAEKVEEERMLDDQMKDLKPVEADLQHKKKLAVSAREALQRAEDELNALISRKAENPAIEAMAKGLLEQLDAATTQPLKDEILQATQKLAVHKDVAFDEVVKRHEEQKALRGKEAEVKALREKTHALETAAEAQKILQMNQTAVHDRGREKLEAGIKKTEKLKKEINKLELQLENLAYQKKQEALYEKALEKEQTQMRISASANRFIDDAAGNAEGLESADMNDLVDVMDARTERTELPDRFITTTAVKKFEVAVETKKPLELLRRAVERAAVFFGESQNPLWLEFKMKEYIPADLPDTALDEKNNTVLRWELLHTRLYDLQVLCEFNFGGAEQGVNWPINIFGPETSADREDAHEEAANAYFGLPGAHMDEEAMSDDKKAPEKLDEESETNVLTANQVLRRAGQFTEQSLSKELKERTDNKGKPIEVLSFIQGSEITRREKYAKEMDVGDGAAFPVAEWKGKLFKWAATSLLPSAAESEIDATVAALEGICRDNSALHCTLIWAYALHVNTARVLLHMRPKDQDPSSKAEIRFREDLLRQIALADRVLSLDQGWLRQCAVENPMGLRALLTTHVRRVLFEETGDCFIGEFLLPTKLKSEQIAIDARFKVLLQSYMQYAKLPGDVKDVFAVKVLKGLQLSCWDGFVQRQRQHAMQLLLEEDADDMEDEDEEEEEEDEEREPVSAVKLYGGYRPVQTLGRPSTLEACVACGTEENMRSPMVADWTINDLSPFEHEPGMYQFWSEKYSWLRDLDDIIWRHIRLLEANLVAIRFLKFYDLEGGRGRDDQNAVLQTEPLQTFITTMLGGRRNVLYDGGDTSVLFEVAMEEIRMVGQLQGRIAGEQKYNPRAARGNALALFTRCAEDGSDQKRLWPAFSPELAPNYSPFASGYAVLMLSDGYAVATARESLSKGAVEEEEGKSKRAAGEERKSKQAEKLMELHTMPSGSIANEVLFMNGQRAEAIRKEFEYFQTNLSRRVAENKCLGNFAEWKVAELAVHDDYALPDHGMAELPKNKRLLDAFTEVSGLGDIKNIDFEQEQQIGAEDKESYVRNGAWDKATIAAMAASAAEAEDGARKAAAAKKAAVEAADKARKAAAKKATAPAESSTEEGEVQEVPELQSESALESTKMVEGRYSVDDLSSAIACKLIFKDV